MVISELRIPLGFGDRCEGIGRPRGGIPLSQDLVEEVGDVRDKYIDRFTLGVKWILGCILQEFHGHAVHSSRFSRQRCIDSSKNFTRGEITIE